MPGKMRNNKIHTFRNILRRFEREAFSLASSQCCCGVSLAQCHAILEMGELGESTINDLARSLGLDKSTVSRSVDSLVRLGLANRETRSGNRRSVIVSLTARGREICEQINALNDNYFERVFQAMPAGKHAAVIDAFKLLTSSMSLCNTGPSCCGNKQNKDEKHG